MRSLTFGDQQILLLVISPVLTRVKTGKYFFNYYLNWVDLSLGLVSEVGRAGAGRNCVYFFGGLLLGGSDVEKWSDHEKKKFFVNNSLKSIQV